MKIAYLIYGLDKKHGWGRYASDLIEGVRKAGHEAIIIKMIDDGMEGHVAIRSGLGMWGSIKEVRSLCTGCDIVHAIDVYPYGILGYFATLFSKKKLIISVLGTYSVAPFYNWKTKFFSQLAIRAADAVVSISNFTKSRVLKLVSLKHLEVITPGIDFEAFRVPRENSTEDYILSVGAFKPRKGYDVSISAFALLKEKFPNVKYKIIGNQNADRNYVAKIHRLIKEKGLQNDVEILSGVSDENLKHLYAQAKLFILSSVNEGHHFEGFGIVFVEAAAAGLPVIGTRGNGIEDAVQDGVNGFLVSQNNIQETASAIENILKDEDLRQHMSKASYVWAQKNTIQHEVSQFLNMYKSL